MRKIILMLTLSLLILSLSALNRPFFPKISLIEVCASTQSESNDLNAGLNIINNEYKNDQAIVLKYYSTNGSMGNADTQNMISSLGASTFPSAYMNGSLKIKGSKSQLQDGNVFKGLIQKEYYDPAALYIYNVTLNTQNGAIAGIIQDATDNSSLQNLTIQYVLVEDNVSGINNVVRKVVSEPFSINNDGGAFTINETLTIEGGWNSANLKAVIIVRNNEHLVLQSASSQTVPEKRLRIVAPFSRYDKVPINTTHDFDYVTIFSSDYLSNYSTSITVSVNEYKKPDDWFISYCGHENCYPFPSQHNLNAGDTISFHPTVQAYSEGSATLFIKAQVQDMPDVTVPFNLITNNADILLIDDDGAKNVENIYYTAFPFTGLSYACVDLNVYQMNDFDFSGYNTIIWAANNPWTFIPNSILSPLQTHLNDGGNLLVNGTSLGWTLTNDNSLFKNASSLAFYNQVLSASNPENSLVTPIQIQGMPSTLGYELDFQLINIDEFAQLYPESFTADANAVVAFKNQNNTMGIQKHYVLGNVAYFSFGLEGISEQLNIRKILNRSLTYFGHTVAEDNQTQTQKPQLIINAYPNPFSNQTSIEIQSKSTKSTISAEVFNIKGQKVYQTELNLNNGKAAFVWDAKDTNNKLSANGIYFVRINDQKQSQIKKIIRLK